MSRAIEQVESNQVNEQRLVRCSWAKGELYEQYHDEEWGVPEHDDHVLFEFVILEGAQAGLSWSTILNKRENYRAAFEGFDPRKVAKFGDRQIERLMSDTGIVRNRLKIASAIQNAKAFLQVQKENGSFNDYVWQFADTRSTEQRWNEMKSPPAKSPESDALSRDLKKRGFKFVGSTICYAFMQATGMVNDHSPDCFRHLQIG